VLQLYELAGLRPRDVALLPYLSSLKLLTLVAPSDDAWLGLAPLRLLSTIPGLQHLDWVPSERALPNQLRAEDLQALLLFTHLHTLTMPTSLDKYDQLHAALARMAGGCQLRLMSPVYCEHVRAPRVSAIQRLISVASDLIDRATGAMAQRGEGSAAPHVVGAEA